jgi:peptidoglycan/xylan/chitin deacetylase (PgdA/CDA1 family)
MAARELTAPAAATARGPRVPVLMYHVVADAAPGRAPDKYTVSTGQFREQIGLVERHGFRLSRLDELWDAPAPAPAGAAVITFDDGEASHYTRAFPLLMERGGRADFFVNTATVGREGFLTWPQIAEMQRAGMGFHSHSHDHVVLLGLRPEALRRQLRDSRQALEDRLGAAVTFLAAPYGLLDRRVVSTALEAGYRAVCTSSSRPGRPGADTVGRLAVYPWTAPAEFVRLLRLRPGTLLRRRARETAVAAPKRVLLRVRPRWLGVQVLEAGR